MTTHAVALPQASPRPLLRGAWVLSSATLASGVLTYAFHVLAARTLGPEAYGRIAVLWASLFLAAVVLCRPLEQTTSRALADRLARGEETATVIRAVSMLTAAVVALTGCAALAGWSVVRERLFDGSTLLTAMLVGGLAVYAAAYLVRGLLSGLGWFPGYGLALAADTAARLALALPLVLVASEQLAAVAVAAAGAAGIIVPIAVGRARLRTAYRRGNGRRFHAGAALAFAAPVSVVAAADQLFVNGGPILVAAAGSETTAAAGVVFAATMLVRIPVFLFQGLAASLLPNLTQLQALDDGAAFRRAVARVAGALLAAGAVVLVGAVAFGPEALRLVYGAGFEASRLELGLLAAGVGCYLAASTASQALLALDRAPRAAVAWGTSAALFVTLYIVVPGEALLRIGTAFAAAAVSGLALLAALLVAAERRG